jgi:hypothetical protein
MAELQAEIKQTESVVTARWQSVKFYVITAFVIGAGLWFVWNKNTSLAGTVFDTVQAYIGTFLLWAGFSRVVFKKINEFAIYDTVKENPIALAIFFVGYAIMFLAFALILAMCYSRAG